MKTLFKNNLRLVMLAVLIVLLAASGCKSKKKAMEASATKAKIEKEDALRKQREEELRKKEAEAKAREEEAKRSAELKDKVSINTNYVKLEEYFSAIANAATVASANKSIAEALTMFSTDQTPVLIVISEEGGQKDYDKPTTIKDYLNYLKDQKKNINRIGTLQYDASGKIKEVELLKRN